jgi:hypothetical protein
MLGGAAAVLLYNTLHDESLLVVVGLVGVLGFGHAAWRIWRQRHPIMSDSRWSLSGFFSPRSIAAPSFFSPAPPTERTGLVSGNQENGGLRYRAMVIDIDSEDEDESGDEGAPKPPVTR